jgi:hypothetical protein
VSDEETFDLAAAGLRADGADLKLSVEVLANKLEQSLPERVRVERSRGGLLGRGERRVRELEVELDGISYALSIQGGSPDCSRVKTVGGVAIKREALAPDAWVAAVTEALRSEAEHSAKAREALEKLLR